MGKGTNMSSIKESRLLVYNKAMGVPLLVSLGMLEIKFNLGTS